MHCLRSSVGRRIRKGESWSLSQIRDLLTQVQTGARITTAIGEPVQVGNRVIIPVAEVGYGGGGGGGGGKTPEAECEGLGGGGGVGVRIRPLGCWIISPTEERWLPAVDVNRLILVIGAVLMLGMVTVRAFARR